MLADIEAAAGQLMPSVVELRRAIHCDPELGLQLPRTREKILLFLKGLPLEIRLATTTSGIIAILRGAKPGKTVLLRGDMDALPLKETSNLPFASKGNAMHACGHDLHVAMLAGAARILCKYVDKLAGNVVFMFQPGEELFHGAKFMLEDPGLIPESVDNAFGIHVSPNIPLGTFAGKPGPLMAAMDTLSITVTGAGGHAALPWHSIDPLPAACTIVLGLQNMVSRFYSPVADPTVLSIASFKSGMDTSNIIPKEVNMLGTLRTFSEETRLDLHKRIDLLCTHTAASYNCTATVKIEKGYPVTVNDEAVQALLQKTVTKTYGPQSWKTMPATTGTEDFSYVLQKFPGVFVFLGTPPEEGSWESCPGCHSDKAVFNEGPMSRGMVMHCLMAFELLGLLPQSKL